MARRAGMIFPDVAHHVTQRGDRREPTSFGNRDTHNLLRATPMAKPVGGATGPTVLLGASKFRLHAPWPPTILLA